MEQIRSEYENIMMTGGLKLPLHFFQLFSVQFLVGLLTAILHALHYGIHWICNLRNDSTLKYLFFWLQIYHISVPR